MSHLAVAVQTLTMKFSCKDTFNEIVLRHTQFFVLLLRRLFSELAQNNDI